MVTTENRSSLKELLRWVFIAESSEDYIMKRMTDAGINAFLILEAGRLTGFVSEGDAYNKLTLSGNSFDEVRLRGIISENGIDSSYDQVIKNCLMLTEKNQVLHLPIMVDGYLIGIISIEELASTMLSDI
jgi:CBS domain-containing protein